MKAKFIGFISTQQENEIQIKGKRGFQHRIVKDLYNILVENTVPLRRAGTFLRTFWVMFSTVLKSCLLKAI